MKKPDGTVEIYLQPGDFYFGAANTRIGTLLGSCVSVTMWHPGRLIGGMCHFMLPGRRSRPRELAGKYADEAMAMFRYEISRHKTRIQDYDVKLFGGGVMFPEHHNAGSVNISEKNISAAYALFAKYDIKPVTTDLGSSGHRRIIFDVWNGNVWVRYQPLVDVKTIDERD
jgi:chemotaxis protein CheD